jgi:NADH:ubiquinone oxidoreductase subunit E
MLVKEPQPTLSAKRSELLGALYAAQDQHGYLNEEGMTQVADQLDLPLKDAYSTATFSSMFHVKATGQYIIQVCEGLSCHLAGGGQELVDRPEQKLGTQAGQTTPDGRFPEEVSRLVDQLAGR